ncbi:monovalent cation:proton antiporter-2 (CPA2) family protein [Halocynthiibacter namhaensis]|uniref:monovalent cation:proton antiporter-2 (CPA2) family protein n=1 Tax=Halocynthiibacter namhaensis TaxID=1290553 RepID=UPI00057936C7|nr:monovalent cation:proton antiporter-2 (CPA2) family protein [Halocynthiibacter namhaensis]
MQEFLLQATIYLGAAVIAVPIASRLGLGSVLGYLMAGILIGPVIGLVGDETESLRHFAEFGVVMMLFIVGLELDPRALWDMRKKLLGLGGLQISLTTLAVMGACMWIGYNVGTSLAIGLTFALSSTAIVLQTLSEKGLMASEGGRNSFAVLLTQDIAVIPMLALVPLLAVPGLNSHHGGGHGAETALSLVEGLPGWGVTLVTIAAIAGVILAGHYLTQPLFRYAHMARLRELYTALSLLIVIGIAFLMSLVGLSAALGTFLAGVVLANSEFRHELEADVEPFKGLLLGVFFITVGAGIRFDLLFATPFLLIGATIAVMTIKGLVLYGIGLSFGLKGRNQWLFALSLAQAGEFGFVMLGFMVQTDVLPTALADQLLLIVALSMLLTPLLFILFDRLSDNLLSGAEVTPDDEITDQGEVIVAGIGRFGQIVNRMINSSGFSTVVLDHNLQAVNMMKRFGFKTFFGDPTRPDVLIAAGLKDAKILVIAIDGPEAAVKLTRSARKARPDLHIIARARDRMHVYELYQAGANDIVRENFDSSMRAGRYALENLGLTEYEAHQQTEAFRVMDRDAVKELAQYWKQDVAIDDNPEFIKRAGEMTRELDVALMRQLEKMREDNGAR